MLVTISQNTLEEIRNSPENKLDQAFVKRGRLLNKKRLSKSDKDMLCQLNREIAELTQKVKD